MEQNIECCEHRNGRRSDTSGIVIEEVAVVVVVAGGRGVAVVEGRGEEAGEDPEQDPRREKEEEAEGPKQEDNGLNSAEGLGEAPEPEKVEGRERDNQQEQDDGEEEGGKRGGGSHSTFALHPLHR